MKKLPLKFVQLLCLMAMIVLGFPFFRIPTGEIMTNGYMPADKHSGLGFIWETVAAYFSNSYAAPNKSLVIIAFTVGIIALMQFVAGIIKRTKLIIATAAVMVMVLVAGMLYVLNSDLDVTIRWGYFLYLGVQLVLGAGTPIDAEKKQEIKK